MSSLSSYYARVILPLPIAGVFTYAIPPEFQTSLSVGERVVVQFGRKKLYTGVVHSLAATSDQSAPKQILDRVDESPIVTVHQLKLWEWIADYYLCTLGEVMDAALPSGLKLNSETQVYLEGDLVLDELGLNDKEFRLVEALNESEYLTLNDVELLLNRNAMYKVVKQLQGKGIVGVREELIEKYKPRWENYVRLKKQFEDEDLLSDILEDWETSAKARYRLMIAYLDLAEEGEVLQSDLLKQAKTTSTTIKKVAELGILEQYKKQQDRLPGKAGEVETNYQLSPAQQIAISEIRECWEEKDVALLYGLTGSGKTHIYIELIKEAIAKGKQVLYLLPEIAITAQIVQRLREVFGDKLGVYHSKFNDNERVEIWQKTLRGDYQVLLGVRSAVFLPFNGLGLVVVDEEHDWSYKQHEPAPRYHARDTAIYLAGRLGAKVVLGSGTPSLDSYFNAQKDKYGLITLNERYGEASLPTLEVVDVKEAKRKRKIHSHFSDVLVDAMKETLEKGEQIILFQNRRGYSPYLICGNCAWIPWCPNCDVSLTYHKFQHKLKCHYCNYQAEVPKSCLKCGSDEVQMKGFGTEKIEDELAIFFPEAKLARLDMDTTRSKHGYVKIINDMVHGRTDILIGTQMVTKGLDMGNVSLVGILDADLLLNFPDMRTHERAFQLMEQVSGRAGRRETPGRVIVQTSQPEHEVIQLVKHHNYYGFVKQELQTRNDFHYPPYFRIIRITLKHKDANTLGRATYFFGELMRKRVKGELLGPAPAIIPKLRGYYQNEMLIKVSKRSKSMTANKSHIQQVIENLRAKGNYPSIRISIDVDI